MMKFAVALSDWCNDELHVELSVSSREIKFPRTRLILTFAPQAPHNQRELIIATDVSGGEISFLLAPSMLAQRQHNLTTHDTD
jgi:hypothetical protein